MKPKKIWSMLHALYFMLGKNKFKNIKSLLDLSMMIKRGKIVEDSCVDRHHHYSNVLPGECIQMQ